MTDGPVPEEARHGIAGLPGGPLATILRLIGVLVMAAAAKKLDAWLTIQFPGVPRWVVVVCAIALFLLTVFALFRMGAALSKLAYRLVKTWGNLRTWIDRQEGRLDGALAQVSDTWFFSIAGVSIFLSCLVVFIGSRSNLLPSKGVFSAASLLFFGFLLASTCIGLCASVKTKVWAIILFGAGLGMWIFSAAIS